MGEVYGSTAPSNPYWIMVAGERCDSAVNWG